MKRFGTAVILAGGKSRRMGFDKQFLNIREKRLYKLTIECLRNAFDDILIVTNTPNLYADENVRTCEDVYKDMGPLAGIHAALSNSKSEYIFLIACDMPVISLSYIEHMKQEIVSTGVQVCLTKRNGWIEPFNAFYSISTIDEAENRLSEGNSSVFSFVNSVNTRVITEEEARAFDPEMNMFMNLNTGEEYELYISEGGCKIEAG